MKKYIFLTLILLANSCFADRFIVEFKQHATKSIMEIERMGYKIKDVRNLDQEIYGNVLIVFE